jgi:hypothetical protein
MLCSAVLCFVMLGCVLLLGMLSCKHMVHLGVRLGSATTGTSAAWRLGDPQGLPSCTNAHAQQPCAQCVKCWGGGVVVDTVVCDVLRCDVV